MRQSVNVIKQLLDECSDQDREEWKSHAQTIPGAIRLSDPTRRGVKGAIAAAFFEDGVMPDILKAGWMRISAPQQEAPFSIVIEKSGVIVRVLIAILQLDAGKPKRYHPRNGQRDRYVVQVQKKLIRAHATKDRSNGDRQIGFEPKLLGARAFPFGEFDILAVNVHPATRRWTDFRFTLSTRLAARKDHPSLMAAAQLVPLEPDSQWTSDFATCLQWVLEETAGTGAGATSATNTS